MLMDAEERKKIIWSVKTEPRKQRGKMSGRYESDMRDRVTSRMPFYMNMLIKTAYRF